MILIRTLLALVVSSGFGIAQKGPIAINDSMAAGLFDAKTCVAGRADAPVKIVAFVDYDCPHCRIMIPAFEREAARAKNVVVYIHQMPLRSHKLAVPAATIAMNAESKGIFPKVDHALMQGGPLSGSSLRRVASQFDLSSSASAETSGLISADQKRFTDLGLNYVPVFLVIKHGQATVHNWSEIQGKLSTLGG